MAVLETDVLVIGAGLSGAVVTKRLAEAGIAVTCLEQGRRWSAEDYRGPHDDWELSAMGPWHPSPNVRQLPEDYPIDDTSSDMKPLLFNGVGGSTVLYGAFWMRMLPSDFRVRSLDGVADDWPIAYEELAPYYDRVDADFGASGIANDPAYPERPEYPMPPLPIGAWGEKVAAAHNRLGWHWWPGSNAIASRPYRGRRPCVQRSACGMGCSEGAKASVDITHWPEAEKLGAKLITGARVSRLTMAKDGRVDGAIYRLRDGSESSVKTRAVVLAASAIGTARLLLMSAEGGLANSSGLVGKRLMMHPFTRAVGFFDEPLGSTQGHWGQSLYSMEFAETDTSRGFVRGAKWNLTPSGGPLGAALFPWDDGPSWGAQVHDRVGQWLGRSTIWGISCEDLPEERNTVTLDPRVVDSDGNPAVRMTYSLSENSKAMLAFNLQQVIESLEAAGAHRVISRPFMGDFGWHPLGTCRMGDDKATSVVDRWGRSHDIPNLFIADGSVLVTGSSVNPSNTIAALALRTADHIVATRGVKP
ncbi:MAG: GMC family oxidoreductase [Hyphomicrobiaceae bacterium]